MAACIEAANDGRTKVFKDVRIGTRGVVHAPIIDLAEVFPYAWIDLDGSDMHLETEGRVLHPAMRDIPIERTMQIIMYVEHSQVIFPIANIR